MHKFNTSAVILAGGTGSRMMSDKTKQFLNILGKTVIERTVTAFDRSLFINEIIVVVREEEADQVSDILSMGDYTKPIKIVSGGECRAASAKRGFEAIDDVCNYVAIHDAARCLITPEMIDKVVEKAHKSGAATAVCGITDTVKTVDDKGIISATLSRDVVYRAQTPQVFSKELYTRALLNCIDFSKVTDDNMLIESIGVDIYTVDLGYTNIKITTPEDLTLAKNILIQRGEEGLIGFRIGHGYDVHCLVGGRKLVLGGVEIPNSKGLLGHSDADVLLHAIMDSLLGAAALGDIGRHFPDSSDEYLGISSMHLLTLVSGMLRKNGFKVVNIDATVVLQSPKIAQYIAKMVSNIAFALGVSEKSINIKATTEEHLGFTGREEGIAAHSVAMLAVND